MDRRPRYPPRRVRRSIAFVALCGFGELVDRAGDDVALSAVTTFRAEVRRAASSCGVRVDKWFGDGALLVGVDEAPLRCAVDEIRGGLRAGDGPLAVRAGIATGPVLLVEGDAYLGGAVSLAARLCERADPFQVLFGADGVEDLPAA